MAIWVIIPLKPLNRAKSRLSDVLTPVQRQKLAEMMFRHVLQVVKTVPQVIGTLVISRDSKALSIAREYDAKTVQESGAPELNPALTRATQVVASWNGAGVLVLPGDLPLLAAEDVSNIIRLAQNMVSVVIATDRLHDGTNALLMRPPGLIDYAFGANSFQQHVKLAREAGVEPVIYESDRLSLDIDLPDDLKRYEDIVSGLDYETLDLAGLIH